MADPTLLNLYTIHGHWKARAHADGTLEVVLFHPFTEQEAVREISRQMEVHAAKNDAANAILANPIPKPPAPEVTASEPSLIGKAVLWAMAEVSQMVNGKLDDAQYQGRIDACQSCDALDAREAPLVGYCKACGCGQNSRSELTVKGRMPGATCPKNKWAPLAIATEASQ